MKLSGGFFLLFAAAATAQADESPAINYPTLPHSAATAEEFVSPGWVVASKVKGDLNRDGRSDVVLALWTEQAAKATRYEEQRDAPPYRLVIGFAQRDGSYRLVTDNKVLIEPPGYSGAYEDPLDANSLRIVRGSLDISRDLLRGHYRYRFRWSDNAFRLIGYEYVGSDGACITSTSINYLTRRAKIEVMPINEDWRRATVRSVKRGPLATMDEVGTIEFFAEGMGVIGTSPDCPRTDG